MKHPRLLAFALLILTPASPAHAAEVKVLLPLGRTAYQTNERIDVSVLRGDAGALQAGDLVLRLKGEGDSALSFTFPVKVAPAGQAVEHLYVNGWLLRPGKYALEVSCDGATASQPIEVFSHVRKSSFRLVNWGRAKGKDLLTQGEDNLGFNLFYGHYGQDEEANLVRAGVDFMANCTMGGGHQMDLRMDCDWSDPYVVRGGTRRVVRRAFIDRTRPNVPGVHFYDEPGLTWHKHPGTGEFTPQGIPSQLKSFEAAFGEPPLPYSKVDPKDPEHVRRWAQWARWKLGLMDAAWQDSQFGVSWVRPDYLSVTQSQYGWTAFTDGYYFNVVRSLPVISGHGGYHDFGPGYFNPSMFLEFARARDLARPNWYLPTWYGNTTADHFRLEQYLSFQTGIQGMISPPDLEPGDPSKSKAAAGIVESNRLMGRLGTIFTTMPPTRPPVAVLFSLSALIKAQTENTKLSYAHDTKHGQNLVFPYLAGKLLHQPLQPVLDEDILDGTLAAHHKAVILTSLDYLDPDVVSGLEEFAGRGGLVLLTADCKVKVKGGKALDVVPAYPDAAKMAELTKAGKAQEAHKLTALRYALAGAKKLADAIQPHLHEASILPVFRCYERGIVATRHTSGDVVYLFAVNATHDPKGDPMLGMKPVSATIELGGVPYDAVCGGRIKDFRQLMTGWAAGFHFGPGQMRVFAFTGREIGGVQVATADVQRDYTARDQPLRVDVAAAVLDTKGGLISGSIPLRVRVVDPLGVTRYDLHRATDRGALKLSLPLALNDPAGKWTVQVTELLNNTHDSGTFTLEAVPTCNIAGGAAHRAAHVAQDRANVFRFFRTQHKITIVKGSGDYDAAAERLVRILKPWNVQATVVKAADVAKPRSLSAEEAETWIGLSHTNKGALKPNSDKNDPAQVGYAVQGPVILLGTPEDNPLIKTLHDYRFLPYAPKAGEFPGPGRGYVAWQRDGVGVLQESITLIAHDSQGMAEAVGTMYEMLAGIEPLTPWALARRSTVAPATKGGSPSEGQVAWSVVVPDRVIGLRVAGDDMTVLTSAGVLATVKGGKVDEPTALEGDAFAKKASELAPPVVAAAVAAAQKQATPGRVVKLVAEAGGRTAVAYWGGRVEVRDQGGQVVLARSLPQDVTALAWQGGRLVVGDADGRVTALELK